MYLRNVFYAVVLIASSPWLLWRYLRQGKNRRGWSQKLFGLVPPRQSNQPCFWFHAVSVGEVNLLAPVLDQLRRQRPDIEVVISTTTETGFDLAKRKYVGVCVFFFPFDFTWAVKNALRRIRPHVIVLAELEIWPNFICLASRFNYPPSDAIVESRPTSGQPNSQTSPTDVTRIAVINGRLSESSFRGYQRIGWFFNSSFHSIDLVAAQNKTYADRFIALGCDQEKVVVTGSVKYDGVQTSRNNETTKRLAALIEVQPDEIVFLAGSTQFEEDILAARIYLELAQQRPELRLILAPRHPERCGQLVRALKGMGLSVQLRSELPAGSTPSPRSDSKSSLCPILIIDVIGELGAWWGVADVAYVGGSLGSRGGQNMIEPAAYGIPVSFGPHTKNFQIVVSQLLSADAATVVHDEADLRRFVERAISNREWASQSGARAQIEMLRHHGASNRTVELLLHLIDVDSLAQPLAVAETGEQSSSQRQRN